MIEVGPGTGNLTKAILLKKPKKLIVIEKDKNLASALEKKLASKLFGYSILYLFMIFVFILIDKII